MQLCQIHFYQKIARKKVARVNAALFYFASHRKIASQFFSVTNIEENHRCDAIAIPGPKSSSRSGLS